MKHWTATAVICGFLLTLGACGDVDGTGTRGKSSAPNTASDKEQIQQLFATYNSAMTGRRYEEVCSLHTPEFNEELVSEVRGVFRDRRPVTCVRALPVLLASADYRSPPLRSIVVSGATATGRVGPSPTKWRFARVSSAWKVAYAN